MSKRTIWFDMDGTIVDLYNVNNWLQMLRSYDVTPYAVAQPMLDMERLERALNQLQQRGWQLGIISWLSREPQAEYDQVVTQVKRSWLKKYLPSIIWDEINIVSYGIPKSTFRKSQYDILFDDEEKNRNEWDTKYAYTPNNIFTVLTTLTLDY